MPDRADITIVFDCGSKPRQEIITDESRGREINSFVRAGPSKRFFKRKISHDRQFAESLFDDRPEFKTKRVIVRLTSHVVEFNIATKSDEPSLGVADSEMQFCATACIAIQTVDK